MALTLVVLLASGCTRVVQDYPERTPDQVWVAMRAVAEEPRYRDWVVIENAVHADEESRRIEIYRELRRDLAMPATRVQREDRSWRFRVQLVEDAPPTVRFTSRGWAVPAQADSEGRQYLADVAELLSGITPTGSVPDSGLDTPSSSASAPAPRSAPEPPAETPPTRAPAATPPVDIELD